MIVYIDGENVVHQLVHALRTSSPAATRSDILDLNLRAILEELLQTTELEIRYYATSLRLIKTDPILEIKSRDMMHWSGQWANKLISQDISIVKAGKLKLRNSDVCPRCGYQGVIFREKGVDVRLAVDMVVDSVDNKQLVVWSSDADLLPAIQVAKRSGARVKNIAYKPSLNLALAKQCGEWQVYEAKLLERVKK